MIRAGIAQMGEHQFCKLEIGVQFPIPAPDWRGGGMADAVDLKSTARGREGSNPSRAIIGATIGAAVSRTWCYSTLLDVYSIINFSEFQTKRRR